MPVLTPLILLCALQTQVALGQMTNLLLNAGVVITASSSSAQNYPVNNIKTFNGDTLISSGKCFATASQNLAYIKIDFGTSQTIGTVLIITAGNADGTGFQSMYPSTLWIGNSSTNSSNTQCNLQLGETGFYQCKGSGRYLFLETFETATIQICHMAVYAEFNFIDMAYAYVLPTGSTVNTLNRKQPIGFKLAQGIRDFSTTVLAPGQQWQADWFVSRSTGIVMLANVPTGGEYSVYVDALGDASSLCSKSSKNYDSMKCSSNRYLTIKNTGTVSIEIYGLAALSFQEICTTCSALTYLSPTIETVQAAQYNLGMPALFINTQFASCFSSQCHVTYSFLLNNRENDFSYLNTFPIFYGDFYLLLETSDPLFIGSYDVQVTQKIKDNPSKVQVINHFILTVVNGLNPCTVQSLTTTGSPILARQFFLIGGTAINAVFPQITMSPNCNYWLVYELDDLTLASKGFSLAQAKNANYVQANPTVRSMFDYSLKFQMTNLSIIGDYTVKVNVKIKDRPSPPYPSATTPLQLQIPVSVRDCKITNPVTLTSMEVKVGSVLTSKPLVFTVSGDLCGAATVQFVVLDGTIIVNFPALSYDATQGQVKVNNPTAANIGTKTVKFTVSLADVPITPFVHQFTLIVSAFTQLIVDQAKGKTGSQSSILTFTNNDHRLAIQIFYGVVTVSANMCMQTNTQANPWLLVNLGTTHNIKTVLIIAGGSADGVGFDQIGPSELTLGEYQFISNPICNPSVESSGFHDCVATGQILKLQRIGTGQLSICKFAAFTYYNIADLGIDYLSTAANGSVLGRKFPSQIKVADKIQDRTTVILNGLANPATWRVKYGTSYQIVGLAVVMKAGSVIKAYVTTTDSYSSTDACNLDAISTENLSMITCDIQGSYVWIVAQSGIAEIYAVAIFKSSNGCADCKADFKFIPNQPSIKLQTFIVGEQKHSDSLLFGNCPELNCELSIIQSNPSFLPAFQTNKYVLQSATNQQLGTYETNVQIALSAEPTIKFQIDMLTKVVQTQNNCQVTSITTIDSLVLNPISYEIGIGASPSQITLPFNFVQTPDCQLPIKYTILNPDSSLTLKTQSDGKTILEVSEADPLKARTFTAQLKVGLQDSSLLPDAPTFTVQILLLFKRFKNQLQGLTPQFSSLASGQPVPIPVDFDAGICLETQIEPQPQITVDMNKQMSILTVGFIQDVEKTLQTNLSVYVSDDPAQLGQPCAENILGSGYYPCKATGRYLIFRRNDPGIINACYLAAYVEANISELAVDFLGSVGSVRKRLAAYNRPIIINGIPKTLLAQPSPFWTADFSISRNIFGVSVLALDQNGQKVLATVYVSNQATPLSADKCYTFELTEQQHITCNKQGRFVIVQFNQATADVLVFSIAIFEKQDACQSCATDFVFIPDQQELNFARLFVGQKQQLKSLAYATCPSLQCQVLHELTLQTSQQLGYSMTQNGISLPQVANHQLGLFTYSYKATLVSDPSKVWKVDNLKIHIESDGCTLVTTQSGVAPALGYFIGNGPKTFQLSPEFFNNILQCGYYLEYEITNQALASVQLENTRPSYDKLPSLIVNESDLTKMGDVTVLIRVKAAILDSTQQYMSYPQTVNIEQTISFKDCSFKPIRDLSLTYNFYEPPTTLSVDFVMKSLGCGPVIVTSQSSLASFDSTLNQLKVQTNDISLFNTTQTVVITATNQFQQQLTIPVLVQIKGSPQQVPNVLLQASFASSALNQSNQLTLAEFFTQSYLSETLQSQAKCLKTEAVDKPYIRIDMGQTKSIKTVHIVAAGNADGSGFQDIATSFIYVGDDGIIPQNNKLCNDQITDSGIYSCVASGTYVFLQLQRFGSINICHFAAYEYFNVAHYGVVYSTSDTQSTAALLGVEKPLAIKINQGVRDQNTITLVPNNITAPFWRVDFGTERNVHGVIIVMKVVLPTGQPNEGVLIYVTKDDQPNIKQVCNINVVSSQSLVSVKCLHTGTSVIIEGRGSSNIELYQVGILVEDDNCSSCKTDFQFVPDLPQLVVQTIKVGDPILKKALLYGTCPQLACQISQSFQPKTQIIKNPFSSTITGIQFQSLTNKDVGTYEYRYTATLNSLVRRLNTTKTTFMISTLKIVVVSDGCKVDSLSFEENQAILKIAYLIGSGRMLYSLPSTIQTPSSCNFNVVYQLKTAPQLNYNLQKQSDLDFKLEVDIADFQLANQLIENNIEAEVISTPEPPYLDQVANIVLHMKLLDCRLEPSVKTIPDVKIKQTSDVLFIEERFVSISDQSLCGALKISFSAYKKETERVTQLTGVTYDASSSQIKLYSYKSQEVGTYEVTVVAQYSQQYQTEVKFNLQIAEQTLESQNGRIGILLPNGIFIPLGPQPLIDNGQSIQFTNTTIGEPIRNTTATNTTETITILEIVSKMNLPKEVLQNQLLPLYPQYQALLEKDERMRTSQEKDLFNRFQYMLSDDEDYVNQSGKQFGLPGNQTQAKPLFAEVDEVSINGIFRIEFSSPVFMIKPDVLKQKKRFDVQVVWKNSMYIEEPKVAPIFTWKVVNITESFIDVNIKFSEPLLISQGSQHDQIKVTFSNRYYFRRQTDGEPLAEKSLIILKSLPPQVPSQEEYVKIQNVGERIKSIRDSTGVVLLTCVIMNLPKSLFWGLHSCIQFMSMEPEHGAKMPANAAYVFKQINEITELKVVPMKKLIDKLKWLNALAKGASAFWQAGFFLGIVVALSFIILLIVGLQKLFNYCDCDCIIHKMVIDKIRRKLMFSTMIRAASLGYMSYAVQAFKGIIQKKYSAELTNPKLIRFNQLVYWAIVAFVFVYPIAVTGFLQWKGPKGLKETNIKEKFGSWYMLINVKSRLKICHTTVFLLRRLIVAISIVLIYEHYNFQLVIILVSSFTVSIYNVVTLPFVTTMLNNLEVLNEMIILLSIALMHSFSDAVASETIRYSYGWVYVWVIFSTLILNLLFIGSYIVETLYAYLRKEYYKRCNTKKMPSIIKSGLQRLKTFSESRQKTEVLKQQEENTNIAANLILGNYEIQNSAEISNQSKVKKLRSDSFKSDPSMMDLDEESENQNGSQSNFNSEAIICPQSDFKNVPQQELLLIRDQSEQETCRPLLSSRRQIKEDVVLDAIIENKIEQVRAPSMKTYSQPMVIETDSDTYSQNQIEEITQDCPKDQVRDLIVEQPIKVPVLEENVTTNELDKISDIPLDQIQEEYFDQSPSKLSKVQKPFKKNSNANLSEFIEVQQEVPLIQKDRQTRNTSYLSKTLQENFDFPKLVDILQKQTPEECVVQKAVGEDPVRIDFNPMQVNSINFSAQEPQIINQRVKSGSTSENLDQLLSNSSDLLACISPEKIRNFENQLITIRSSQPIPLEISDSKDVSRNFATSRILRVSQQDSIFDHENQLAQNLSRPLSKVSSKHQRSQSLKINSTELHESFGPDEAFRNLQRLQSQNRTNRSTSKQPRQGILKHLLMPQVVNVDEDNTDPEVNLNFSLTRTRDPINTTNQNMSLGTRTGVYIMSGNTVPLIPKSLRNTRQQSIGSGHDNLDSRHVVVSPRSSQNSGDARIKHLIKKQLRKNSVSRVRNKKKKLEDKLIINDDIASKYTLAGIVPTRQRESITAGGDRRHLRKLQISLQPPDQAVDQLKNIVSNYLTHSVTYAKSKVDQALLNLGSEEEHKE